MPPSKTSNQNGLLQFDTESPDSLARDQETSFDGPVEFSAQDSTQLKYLAEIERMDSLLTSTYQKKMVVETSLTRQLVSFQANKHRAAYRWYKYKEAFSAPLVDFLLSRYDISSGSILDPFAGAGTALFAAADLGLRAEGIELLPIGQEIIRTRLLLRALVPEHFGRLKCWLNSSTWKVKERKVKLPVLRITEGAYSSRTVDHMERYLTALDNEPQQVQDVLRFALLCVLENISFTRKDGQYLRWDYRSSRRQGIKPFDKGEIPEFEVAILAKLSEIINDLSSGYAPVELFATSSLNGEVKLIDGSCLRLLPDLKSESYEAILTSPPYCNRYDYTRTYALELALLGVGEEKISALRQEMLSCTVENRAKDLLALNPAWHQAIVEADQHELLQSILGYLEWCKASAVLNNAGIPRMVRGYFYEMACVLGECRRVLKPGARLMMVNDNVRYAGASISVDLILSSLAERLGFITESIMVLPNGKGNSSQQMGAHGRDALRKCVYVWRRN